MLESDYLYIMIIPNFIILKESMIKDFNITPVTPDF